MRHIYRAYPGSARSLQGVASLGVAASIMARGITSNPQFRAAMIGIGVLAVAVQGVRFIPGRVVIGEDGVLVRWLWSRTFVRRAAIASIEQPGKNRLRIVKKDGSACEIEFFSDKSVAPVHAELVRLRDRAASESTRARHAAMLDTLVARLVSWAKAPDAAEAASPPSIAYRTSESPEQLWEIAADVDAPPLARASAVHALDALGALGALDDAARDRVRELAASSADEATAAALGAVADGDLQQLRAIVSGRSVAVERSHVPEVAEGADHGVMPALLRPNRAILALAWLSRLWFLAPAALLVLRAPALAWPTLIACAVGAMPWAAAREGDPLVRVVPGRVGVEEGFVVHRGETVLELATVTAAYVHHRAGAPPVVRFEGRYGWPMLDVRLESLDEARAFLRALPLREDQRDASFGTMQPGAIRFIAAGAAMVAVAALVALTHLTQAWVFAALGGLAVSATRLRRLVTVKRDGVLLRFAGKTRFIRFDDVAEVERRKGAGVVVLRSGERVPLRSIAGELTDVIDDDLTEVVIDRLEEHRAPRLRARIAGESQEAIADEPQDESVLDTPDEPKRRARSMDER